MVRAFSHSHHHGVHSLGGGKLSKKRVLPKSQSVGSQLHKLASSSSSSSLTLEGDAGMSRSGSAFSLTFIEDEDAFDEPGVVLQEIPMLEIALQHEHKEVAPRTTTRSTSPPSQPVQEVKEIVQKTFAWKILASPPTSSVTLTIGMVTAIALLLMLSYTASTGALLEDGRMDSVKKEAGRAVLGFIAFPLFCVLLGKLPELIRSFKSEPKKAKKSEPSPSSVEAQRRASVRSNTLLSLCTVELLEERIEQDRVTYHLRVTHEEEKWDVWHRFSDFEVLRETMVRKRRTLLEVESGIGVLSWRLPDLGPQHHFRRKFDSAFLEGRKERLRTFIRALVGNMSCAEQTEVRRFFGLPPASASALKRVKKLYLPPSPPWHAVVHRTANQLQGRLLATVAKGFMNGQGERGRTRTLSR